MGQDRQFSTLKLNQQAQCVGVRQGGQSYPRARVSRKAALYKMKPELDKGKASSQLDALFRLLARQTSRVWLTNAHASWMKPMHSDPFCPAYISFL